MKNFGLERNVPVVPAQTALLIIDVQNYTMEGGGVCAGLTPEEWRTATGSFSARCGGGRSRTFTNYSRPAEGQGIEVMYTVIASLTEDGRDLSLDYKISGLHCEKSSRDAQVLEEVVARGDEIVLTKTSSSVFISTKIHYILGNLGRGS